MTECFVCLGEEPPLLTGLCACTDRAVHPACQRALVCKAPKADTRFASVCGACKREYANVRVCAVRRPSRVAALVGMSVLLALVALGGGVAELVCYRTLSRKERTAFVWMVALGVFLIVLGLFAGAFAVVQCVVPWRAGVPLRDVLCPERTRVRLTGVQCV